MSQKPSMASFWKLKPVTPAAAAATPAAATPSVQPQQTPPSQPNENAAAADSAKLSGARRDRPADQDTAPQKQHDVADDGLEVAAPNQENDDPFAAPADKVGPAAPANDAVRAQPNPDGAPLTFDTLGEFLDEELREETATSVATMYQEDEGAQYFTTVFKKSFELWPHGQPCPYGFWCDVLADVSAISSRNLAMRRLAFGLLTILLRGTPQDAVMAIYLCINELAPSHEGKELGVADGTLIPVVASVCGMEEKKVRAQYQKSGDLAEIAQSHKGNLVRFTAPKPLMLGGVFDKFKQIADAKGSGSQAQRKGLITQLIRDAKGCEVNFLIRALQGKMRIGVALKTINAALGHALALRTIITLAALERTKEDNKKGAEQKSSGSNANFYQRVTFLGPGGPAAAAAAAAAQASNAAPAGGSPFSDDEYPLIAPWGKRRFDADHLMRMLKHYAESVSCAYHQFPVVDEIISTICAAGRAALPSAWLKLFKIRAGVPVKPMLAHPTTSIRALLDRFAEKGAFTCEFKYDGERGQIHYVRGGINNGGPAAAAAAAAGAKRNEFEMYSRNSESYTTKFPDVIRGLPEAFSHDVADAGAERAEGVPARVDSFIVDGEVVAVEEGTGRLRPFQVLQSRGKKNVDADNVSCRVRYFAFDLLMLNGEPLLTRPLRERRRLLHAVFRECDMFTYARGKDSDDVEEIQTFLDESVAAGCEGLMVKTLDQVATYQPSQRSHFWLKLKKDYMEGCGDTLDLVCIGGYMGAGKRAGKFGGFLLACYNEEEETFQTICKCGTGYTDEDFEAFYRDLQPQKDPVVRGLPEALAKGLTWITPTQVWEVRAADLSLSPVHTAGLGIVDQGRGVALRFPRFIKTRPDKEPTDATTAAQVAAMYRAQALVQAEAQAGAAVANLEDDEY